jgi:hypothetical protein
MSVKKFTSDELSGKSIAPSHGEAFARLNALIDLANDNEIAVAANEAAIAANETAVAAGNVVDAVITAADASGGETDSAFAVQLNGVDGDPIAKVAVVKIIASDSEYGGGNDPNSNVTFGTATAGSILASGNGWAVVKTDATGAFACTASNSSDETVYFTAADSDGGVDDVTAGAVVRGCVPESATWAA